MMAPAIVAAELVRKKLVCAKSGPSNAVDPVLEAVRPAVEVAGVCEGPPGSPLDRHSRESILPRSLRLRQPG